MTPGFGRVKANRGIFLWQGFMWLKQRMNNLAFLYGKLKWFINWLTGWDLNWSAETLYMCSWSCLKRRKGTEQNGRRWIQHLGSQSLSAKCYRFHSRLESITSIPEEIASSCTKGGLGLILGRISSWKELSGMGASCPGCVPKHVWMWHLGTGWWLDFSSGNNFLIPFARAWKLLYGMGFQSQANLVLLFKALNWTQYMKLEVALESCSSMGHFSSTWGVEGKMAEKQKRICVLIQWSPPTAFSFGLFFFFSLCN